MNPQQLTDLRQWVCWRREERDGKQTKPPRDARVGNLASTTDPSTWASFEEAQQAAQRLNMAGSGFVFTSDDPYAGIDLDKCRNPETGALAPWAQTIVDALDSYTEVSPSKTGVKVFVRATLPRCGRKGTVEVYDRSRYFTVTGDHLEGTPTTIEERDAQVKLLCERLFGSNGKKPDAPTSPPRSGEVSEEIIERAKAAKNGDKFSRLWEGNTTGYASVSEADLALVNILRFWTGDDRSLIDNLFRQSGLFRPKWDVIHYGDGRTYGEATIDRALDGTGETYQPGANAEFSAPNSDEQIELDDDAAEFSAPLLHVVPTSTAKRQAPHLTDMGNSTRWCRQHGDNARWCDDLGGWFLWDGQRWRRDTRGTAVEMAKRTAISIHGGVEAATTLEERKAISKWAVTSEAAFRLSAMLELSRSALPADVAEFDRDPFLLNVLNGTIDLHTEEIRQPSREDMITKLAPVNYDPDATDDVFDSFLLTVTDGDADLARWLQRAIGYSLTGDMTEQTMVVILGPTGTGKSTLLHAVVDMLGGYGHVASIETFLQHRIGGAGAARPDVTALRGTRFVVATESPRGRHMDEPLVKAISGGDKVSARTLFHEDFDFYPQCKLWFGTNWPPQVNNLDDAIWRRLRRVPFEATFTTIDPQIKPYLQNNPDARSAILAWAVKGCLDWQRDGLGQAGVVERKTAQLRLEMNPLNEYVDARCELGPVFSVDAATLRSNYADWAKDTGARPISNADWGAQLQELGCRLDRPRIEGKQRRVWRGIGLAAANRLSQENEEPDTK